VTLQPVTIYSLFTSLIKNTECKTNTELNFPIGGLQIQNEGIKKYGRDMRH